METEPCKTGIIYARVSSWEQVSNTSLEKQVRDCEEYAKRNGIRVIAEPFIEEGESAKTVNRPVFQKALAFCAKTKPNYFIVYKIDRFARNQDDHVVTRAYLKKYGTELRSATEPVDESTIGRLQLGVLSVFSEFDNNMRAERSKNGMIEKVKRGEWVWAAPYGYKRITKGGNLIVNEDTAPFVMYIFKHYSTGIHTYRSLAEMAAKAGMRTRQGKKPSMQLIEKILRNPLYYGQIKAFNMEVQGKFESLIAEELFWKCQPGVKVRSHAAARHEENNDFPLRRLVVCSTCGKSLTGSHSRGRSKKYAYYHHHKQDCPAAVSIPKETLEQNFIEFLGDISPSLKNEKAFRAIVVDVWQSNFKKLDADNARIRREIETLEAERQKIFDLHRTGKYSDDDFIEQKELVTISIHQKKALLEEKRVEEFNMDEALEYCFNFARQSGVTWQSLASTPALRARFQKSIFPENVTFDGEKFGTGKMSLIYELNQSVSTDSSKLVTPRGIEPRFDP